MRLLPVLALSLAACGAPRELSDVLTERVGCGDTFFFAYDDASTALLTVLASDLVADTPASQTERTVVWELPDPDVDVVLEEGRNVADAACDDLVEGDIVVQHTSEATAGTLTITARPNANVDENPEIDVLLEDVELSEDGEVRATIERLQANEIGVGWLPG